MSGLPADAALHRLQEAQLPPETAPNVVSIDQFIQANANKLKRSSA